MKILSHFLFAILAIAFCNSVAFSQRQTTLYIDNGFGAFTKLTAPGTGGALQFPPGSGTILMEPLGSPVGPPAILQSLSPGTLQTGNINVSGTILGGSLGIGTTPTLATVAIAHQAGNVFSLSVAGQDIQGSEYPILFTSNTTGQTFGTNTYGRILRFQDLGQSSFYEQGIDGNGSYFVMNGPAYREDFVLTPGGQIGIGTTTPPQALSVAGTSVFGSGLNSLTDANDDVYLENKTGLHFTQMHLYNLASGVSGYVQANDNGYSAFSGGLSTAGFQIWTRSKHPLSFGTNTTFAMIIDTDQHVGIGTTAPAQALDVEGGNVQFSGALMPNAAAGTMGDVLTSQGPNAPPTWGSASSSSDFPNGITVENGSNTPYAATITSQASSGLSIQCLTQSGTSLNNTTHFIDFIDGSDTNNVRGSIQGEDLVDLTSDPAYAANLAAFIVTNVTTVAQIITGVGAWVVAAYSGLALIPEAACIITLPAIPQGVASTLNVIITAINAVAVAAQDVTGLVAYIITAAEQDENLGVQYSSSGADYAEYLKIENPNDHFYPGDIVGVRNGLISKNTNSAQNVFSISTAPLVLGNEPPKGEEAGYAKVGFLGQVPVKVRGIVHPGNFVMASGLNDGIGVAVSPDKITPQQFTSVLGRAWTASQSNGINLVKVAVGLSTKDVSEIASHEQVEIDSLKMKSDANNASIVLMNARLDKLASVIAEPDPAKRQSLLAQPQQPNASSQIATVQKPATPMNTPNPPTPQPDLIAQTQKLTNNAVNKMLLSGPPITAMYDKITQLPSFTAVKERITSNIKTIMASSDSPKTKGQRVKQYLTAPDPATRQAFGVCALEAIPVMKSVVSTSTSSTTQAAK